MWIQPDYRLPAVFGCSDSAFSSCFVLFPPFASVLFNLCSLPFISTLYCLPQCSLNFAFFLFSLLTDTICFTFSSFSWFHLCSSTPVSLSPLHFSPLLFQSLFSPLPLSTFSFPLIFPFPSFLPFSLLPLAVLHKSQFPFILFSPLFKSAIINHFFFPLFIPSFFLFSLSSFLRSPSLPAVYEAVLFTAEENSSLCFITSSSLEPNCLESTAFESNLLLSHKGGFSFFYLMNQLLLFYLVDGSFFSLADSLSV